MNFPIQAPPVHRPALVDPGTLYRNIDDLDEDQKETMQVMIGFDANFNDPQWFALPSAEAMKVSAWPGCG